MYSRKCSRTRCKILIEHSKRPFCKNFPFCYKFTSFSNVNNFHRKETVANWRHETCHTFTMKCWCLIHKLLIPLNNTVKKINFVSSINCSLRPGTIAKTTTLLLLFLTPGRTYSVHGTNNFWRLKLRLRMMWRLRKVAQVVKLVATHSRQGAPTKSVDRCSSIHNFSSIDTTQTPSSDRDWIHSFFLSIFTIHSISILLCYVSTIFGQISFYRSFAMSCSDPTRNWVYKIK